MMKEKRKFDDLEAEVKIFPNEMIISPPTVFHTEEQLKEAVHYIVEKTTPLDYVVEIEILYDKHTLYSGKVHIDIDDDFLEFLVSDDNYRIGYLEVTNNTLYFEMCTY